MRVHRCHEIALLFFFFFPAVPIQFRPSAFQSRMSLHSKPMTDKRTDLIAPVTLQHPFAGDVSPSQQLPATRAAWNNEALHGRDGREGAAVAFRLGLAQTRPLTTLQTFTIKACGLGDATFFCAWRAAGGGGCWRRRTRGPCRTEGVVGADPSRPRSGPSSPYWLGGRPTACLGLDFWFRCEARKAGCHQGRRRRGITKGPRVLDRAPPPPALGLLSFRRLRGGADQRWQEPQLRFQEDILAPDI
jgi:hypothetical protein